MIQLCRLDGRPFFINPDHLEVIEETPDTILTLTNGNRYLVKETAREVIERLIAFRAEIIRRAGRDEPAGEEENSIQPAGSASEVPLRIPSGNP